MIDTFVELTQDEPEYRKRQAEISAEISAPFFRVTCKKTQVLIQKNSIARRQHILLPHVCAHLVGFYPIPNISEE